METLLMIFSCIVRVAYFYMLHWWGAICFVAIAFIVVFVKHENREDDRLYLDPWRYWVPRSILDASVWPLWIIFGITELDLAHRANEITDSLLVGGIITLDLLAWTYLRYGHANFLLALLAEIIIAAIWLPLLHFHFQFQDPEEALKLLTE
jgi:hypothetical protein